jgi:adenylate cyclase
MLPIGTPLGHFRITALLGAGGMGEVYRARDERLRRDVAIKVFPSRESERSGTVDRFLREAQAASALNHPNIVTIHEVGETDVGRYIVMELVDGRSLRQLMGSPMPIDALIQLAIQLARALTAAHAAGITHRDVKPENIMVRDDGYAKVLDFGLARLSPAALGVDGAARTEAATEVGVVMGTFRYMSPEQTLGEHVDAATDVFSLGLVLYELLAGQHPFGAESGLGAIHAIAYRPALGPSLWNPEIPAPLDALILRMLEKNPRVRPTSADVGSALVDLLGGGPRIAAPSRPVLRRIVGRARERAQMMTAFDAAVDGQGLVLCVTGEPGLGKTTLVEEFFSEIKSSGRPCWTARGRCSERLAGTEAYLPFLEALDSMVHSSRLTWASATADSGTSVSGLMKLLAPAWYAQVAPLAAKGSPESEPAPGKAVSQEQMKRELISFFQEVSRIRPLILFLDDIHWADVSTTDLLAYLATRLPSMAMLVLATYRQSDLLLAKHPFIPVKLDLQSRGILREVALSFLTREDVQRLLALQYGDHQFPPEFTELIHTKTEGNPLFIVDLLHDLQSRHVIADSKGRWTLAAAIPAIERELPESARSMIRRKIEQLEESDRRLLVAASVQGPEFDSTIVARALGLDPADVEDRLTVLEQVHAFVRRSGERELPDRSLTVAYHFVHVLYQNALYASLTATRKIAISSAVAKALVDAYGEATAQVATQLALLFDAGREFGRAAEYFLLAAQNAARIFAHHEAVTLSRRGIAMIEKQPASAETAAQELSLQIALGSQVLATQGYAARDLGNAYARAKALCDQVGETPLVMPALLGLATFHTVRGEYDKARDLSEELLVKAQQFGDTKHPTRANVLLGVAACMLGQLSTAVEHLEPCISIETPRDGSWTSVYGASPGVSSRGYLSFTLMLMGYPDRARAMVLAAVKLGHDLSQPLSIVSARRYAWWIHQLRREPDAANEHATTLIALSAHHRFAFYRAWGVFQQGWASTNPPGNVEAGLEQMREGMAALRATGAAQLSTYALAVLAEAYGDAQRPLDGLRALDEAVEYGERSGESFFEAELRRLRGELALSAHAADEGEVEHHFLDALEIARRQEARWLELRAAMSLARVWSRRNRTPDALALLNRIYSWFTEGFETPDLREARALIDLWS